MRKKNVLYIKKLKLRNWANGTVENMRTGFTLIYVGDTLMSGIKKRIELKSRLVTVPVCVWFIFASHCISTMGYSER